MKFATLLLAALILAFPATVLPQPQQDVPAQVDSARNALKGAYNDLEHAGGDWGGHRQNAMNHIQEALKELNQAEQWAKSHHDMK
jgi:hypothetical protein